MARVCSKHSYCKGSVRLYEGPDPGEDARRVMSHEHMLHSCRLRARMGHTQAHHPQALLQGIPQFGVGTCFCYREGVPSSDSYRAWRPDGTRFADPGGASRILESV